MIRKRKIYLSYIDNGFQQIHVNSVVGKLKGKLNIEKRHMLRIKIWDQFVKKYTWQYKVCEMIGFDNKYIFIKVVNHFIETKEGKENE